MSTARPRIAGAFVRVAIWISALSGLLFLVAALALNRSDMLFFAGVSIAIAFLALTQKARAKPWPEILLVAISIGLAMRVPFADRAGDFVIVPTLVLIGSLGRLLMSRRRSAWFAYWCWLLLAITLPWSLPEPSFVEIFLVMVLLAMVMVGASWFVSLASDLLAREERSHREALKANRRLLDFEKALALCSRALLVGSGDEALEKALSTLRAAIGADTAYLTINVEDPEQGFSFQVVKSAIRPGTEPDEWEGDVRPWSKYQMVIDELEAGRTFQHVATEKPGEGWNRSILCVPIYIEGDWTATVGFVDVARQTVWGEEAKRMLEVAAPMLGTFWERETTRKRLEELVESKDRFVASVSHELRTPLAAVLGFAEELRTSAGSFRSDELTGMLELIADQSNEMADMVEDLLVSARADIGTVSINLKYVYLRAQAETVLASIGSAAGAKDIQVVGGRGKVWADPSRTRQIIRNLITNAVRYGGYMVRIESVENDEHTVLTVTDDGPGLDRDHWESIFEPYQRAHEALTQPAAIGLGLTVSRQLARLMGGDLVYACDDRGSVFTVTLPAASGAPETRSEGARIKTATA